MSEFICKECGCPKTDDEYDRTSKGARMLTCKACQKIKRQRRSKQKCACGATGRMTFFKGEKRCDKCLLENDLMDCPYDVPTFSGVSQWDI